MYQISGKDSGVIVFPNGREYMVADLDASCGFDISGIIEVVKELNRLKEKCEYLELAVENNKQW